MELEKNNKIIENLNGMHYRHALIIKNLIEKNNYSNCLELGFNQGKSSCYIASILKDLGGGHLTTIDLRFKRNLNPNIESLVNELELKDYVTYYFERKSYTWRLMKLIEENDEPIFDFCFIDGTHNWYDDGFAFFLVNKLLKPGGLLMMASMNWTYNNSFMKNSDIVQSMDDDEKELAHVKQVYELLVKTHPLYEKFEIIDNRIGVAYKKKSGSLENTLETQNMDTSDFLKSHHFTKLNNEINDLSSKLNNLENNYNNFQNQTSEVLDSDNFLFNTLFLDYKLEPNTLLNNLQTLECELLVFIQNICNKYDLNWWLDGGNLLGAARHENFIPWDDDMDIAMMRADYHKLNEVLQKEINNYGLSDCLTVAYRYRKRNGKAINSFIQLFLNDETIGLDKIIGGIDIFPFDFLKDYDEKSFGNSYERAKQNFYLHLTKGDDRRQMYMGLNKDEVINEYFKNLNLSYEEQKYIIPGVEGSFGYGTNQYELAIFDATQILPLSKIKFGKYEFPCPKNPDYYLKSIYGNYMHVPKNIRTHGRVSVFRTIPHSNEMFEKYINRLKIINGNFER